MIDFIEHVALFSQFWPARVFAQVTLKAVFSSASGLGVGLQDLGFIICYSHHDYVCVECRENLVAKIAF